MVDPSFGASSYPCPVFGVSVSALGSNASLTTTDAEGYFELVLPSGMYIVSAEHPKHRVVVNAKVWSALRVCTHTKDNRVWSYLLQQW